MANVMYETTEKVPTWALPLIVNGDSDGLTDEEKSMINEWVNAFVEDAKNMRAHVLIATIDEDEFFSCIPAFGMACMVVLCKVQYLW